MLSKYIIPEYFLIAFFVGLIITYITVPEPEIVVRYPSPDGGRMPVFRQKSGVCIKYEAEKTTCPSDDSAIDMLDIEKQRIKKREENTPQLFKYLGYKSPN
jgi:hypothetical protein